MLIRISVVHHGHEYFTRLYMPANQAVKPIGEVFSMTEDIEPYQLSELRAKVRQECRRRGIICVINLD